MPWQGTHNKFFERPMSIETQNFVSPEETHITMSVYGAPTVALVNLETGAVNPVSVVPGHHNEPEGIYPDGKHTLVESSRQFLGKKLRSAVQHIDIWKLSLDGNERWQRITHFTDWGWKLSSGALVDYPDLKRPLGPPKGAYQRTTPDGWEFTREFEHASVWVNTETRQAKITWR